MRSENRRRSPLPFLLLPLLAFAALAAWSGLRLAAEPTIEIAAERPAVGRSNEVKVSVGGPGAGLAAVAVDLVQGDRTFELARRRFATPSFWTPWAAPTGGHQEAVTIGREAQPELSAGEATVRVRVERAAGWLRFPVPVVVERRFPVRLSPPRIEVRSTQTYLAQGGAEAVVYRVSESTARHGVEAGSWFFPGYPLPGGGPRDRFALFAAPYDLGHGSGIRLVAEDDAGNRASASFVDQFTPRPLRRDRIELTDRFLDKVVPEIREQTPQLADRGDLLQNYLAINGELRRANAAELVALAKQSRPEFLWREPFLALPNAQVMSAFADRRTYFYQGREVDQQDHLGFDLASVRGAPVPAANRGVVLLARYFGIYGNTVVLDHGFGLATLYSHLSSLEVAAGQTVERGAILGRTGETGLAGGDHLHFSFLLAGLPVTPVEWWDARWIEHRLGRKLGAALPFSR